MTWWTAKMEDALPCELCGSEPVLEEKKTKPWGPFGDTHYRMACRNQSCAGHTGRWQLVLPRAVGAWNASQCAKRSTIKRFQRTEMPS